MSTEVLTTLDKAQRDRIYAEYRNSDDPAERQVVKFSGDQPVLNEFDEQDGRLIQYGSGEPQYRLFYVPTWSVAYPVSVEKQNHGSKRNPRKFPGRKKAL